MSITRGDRVELAYVGRFADGTVFAASSETFAEESDPAPPADRSSLSFTVGEGEVIDGVDEAIVGMEPGDTARVSVAPEDGYGIYDPEKRREYDRETFEGMVGEPPEVGLHVEAQNDLHGDVTAVTDEYVEVDFNHELAGKTLQFEIQVLRVEPP